MSYPLFAGGSYMVLIALVWLIQPVRNAIRYYFVAIYSVAGLIILYSCAERTGLVYKAYPLYSIQIPLHYAFAPLLYYGFSRITDSHRKAPTFNPWHFLPAVASVPLVVTNNLWNESQFASIQGGVAPEVLLDHPAFFAIHLLGLLSDVYILHFLFRIIITGISLLRDKNRERMKELPFLLMYVVVLVIGIGIMIFARLARNRDLLHSANLWWSITFILYSFYSFRHPEYGQEGIPKPRCIQYKNTRLRGLNTEDLVDRLQYLMSNEKIYRNMKLSLTTLSVQLKVTPQQLSQILNERLHVNFRSYVSTFRVREAARLLRERPDASIIAIAFEVGFNSKASFNEHFLAQTGMKPSEFRKLQDTS